MDKQDRLALVFAIVAFGAGGETLRVFTEEGWSVLAVLGALVTFTCVVTAFWFFLKKKS